MSDVVGFVGLGRMGFHMARRLLEHGHTVLGVDVSSDARERAAAVGIRAEAEIGALEGVSVVMSSLPDTPFVHDVYLGEGGLIESGAPGSLWIDLSTIAVDASRDIASSAAERRISFLDAPVSGTSVHAETGDLAIMVGGSAAALDRARPFLAAFAKAVHHMGPSGSGLEMKLITNRLLTTHLVAIAEAVLEMEDAGLEVDRCLEILRAGAVPRLLDYKAPALAARDYSPQFTVGLMAKDLRLADERREPGRVTGVAAAMMSEAEEMGLSERDLGAVMELAEQARGGSS